MCQLILGFGKQHQRGHDQTDMQLLYDWSLSGSASCPLEHIYMCSMQPLLPGRMSRTPPLPVRNSIYWVYPEESAIIAEKGKGKGKVHPRRGHEGPEGE